MTREPPCVKCGRSILRDACTRLECPRQTPTQQAVVWMRWKNAIRMFDRLREPATLATAANRFAEKGWTVRA